MTENENALMMVNSYAGRACKANNKNPFSRRANRRAYLLETKKHWCSPEHQELIRHYKNGEKQLNTYPWPLCDVDFAAWQKYEEERLITDPSNCIVRDSTSYVAYKIFEETGKCPKAKGKKRYAPQKWISFLGEAGYTHVLDTHFQVKQPGHYVGINPRFGKEGIVVWFEGATVGRSQRFEVSTYVDGIYQFWHIDPLDYPYWIKIN